MSDDQDDLYESHALDILKNIGLKTDVLLDDIKDELKTYVEKYLVPLGEAKKSILRKHRVFQEEDKLLPPDCEDSYEVLVGKRSVCSHEEKVVNLEYDLERMEERYNTVNESFERMLKDRYPYIESFPPLRVIYSCPDFEEFLQKSVPKSADVTIEHLFEMYNRHGNRPLNVRAFQYFLLDSQRNGWIHLYGDEKREEDSTDIHHAIWGRLNMTSGRWEEFPWARGDYDPDSD